MQSWSLLLSLLIITSIVCSLSLGFQLNKPRMVQNKRLQMASTPPSTEKARLIVTLQGNHTTNGLFRAEIKKEVTFFRGCGVFYAETSGASARLEAEGKTKQLLNVVDWLRGFEKPLTERKVSFQGPSLMIKIEDIEWAECDGSLKGFKTVTDAPLLQSALLSPDGTMEARNMAGTDESV